MKKFTLMIVAALMAVSASAQKLDVAKLVNPVTDRVKIMSRSAQSKAKPVEPFKFKKKAHKAAAISSIDDLTGTWMQIYYSSAKKAALSTVLEITKTKGSDNMITIKGWWMSHMKSIEATVDLSAGTITIDPQSIFDSPSLELINGTSLTGDAALVGTIEEDGSISFEDDWAVQGEDGLYEFGSYTMLVKPNGKMNFMNSDSGKKSVDVYIEQDIEEETVYVYNFGDYGRTIELTMNSDKTFEVPSDQIFCVSSKGDFYLYGLNETADLLIDLTATGTETTITFDQAWTGYQDDGYWLDINSDCIITLTDGSTFTYPVEPEDVAATPATPTDFVYEVTTLYGPRILFKVPLQDVDGNKLRKDRLFYQIYYMKDGTASPYTLQASIYKKIENDMNLIPYNFTDDWDIFSEKEAKRVYLYGTDGWEKVGVKSIYQGGGETHESGIIWYDIATGEIIDTGISQVNAAQQNGGKAFNLAGQQVKQGYKGIVIKDGKKFMVK